jgi:arylsulfatase A-like enzyme
MDRVVVSRTQYHRDVTSLRGAVLVRLAAAVLVGSGCGDADPNSPPGQASAAKPNVLLLIGDDHGHPYFGFMGNEIVRTPHLDRLAGEGAVFTRAYSTSNVCRPALWTLLTGLQPFQIHALTARRSGTRFAPGRTGVQQWRDDDLAYVEAIRRNPHTLPRALARAGYASFQSGKYWEGDSQGAGFSAGMSGSDRRNGWQQAGGAGLGIGRKSLRPVLDFIDRNTDRPFFVWYAPMLPHFPYDAPGRLRKAYERQGVSEDAAAYYANCSWFDEGVGKLLAHLERRGLRERTLVVYLSDNGFQLEPDADYGHLHGGPQGKLSTHERSFRTPIVLNWPGHIEAGQVHEALASSADLYPTLLDYAGAAEPLGVSGTSLRPVLEGRATGTRDHLIGSTTFLRAAEPELRAAADASEPGDPYELMKREAVFFLVTPEWHYVLNETRGEAALYAANDPSREPQNVIATHAELVRGHPERIEAWKADMLRPLPRFEADDVEP